MTHADILVIGNGMVGHRFVEAVLERDLLASRTMVVVGEEWRRAYDRVHLSSVFDGVDESDLQLGDGDVYTSNGIELVLGDAIVELNPAVRTARTASGRTISFTDCVLATGSAPFVPPIPGTDAAGSFVYRTLDDLAAIQDWARGCRTGVVVGGGLLGLEAANALRLLGLETTVVEFAPRLMAVQLDDGGAAALRHHVEALGLHVRTGAAAAAVRVTPDGRVQGLSFAEGEDLDAELVVFAAGIRPRDQLARSAGLDVGDRGGVVIDDRGATSAPGIWAIGEVACHRGRVYGLVAPGYQMAEVVADQLAGEATEFTGADMSTALKLLGVQVASVGDPHADGDQIVVADATAGAWQKIVVGPDGRVIGAVLVGDTSPFAALVQCVRGNAPTANLIDVLRPSASGAVGAAELADNAGVCSCLNVSCGAIRAAVHEGFEDVPGVKKCTKAGTGCGSCVPLVQELIDAELRNAGRTIVKRLCRHFDMTRPQLFELVRMNGIDNFADLVAAHGTGRGCEICKPVAASIFASLSSSHILDGEHASLQDSNDHFLANIQRDGTYSVVPRVPGGEITAAQLIAIGEVARDFDLYTKITGCWPRWRRAQTSCARRPSCSRWSGATRAAIRTPSK